MFKLRFMKTHYSTDTHIVRRVELCRGNVHERKQHSSITESLPSHLFSRPSENPLQLLLVRIGEMKCEPLPVYLSLFLSAAPFPPGWCTKMPSENRFRNRSPAIRFALLRGVFRPEIRFSVRLKMVTLHRASLPCGRQQATAPAPTDGKSQHPSRQPSRASASF